LGPSSPPLSQALAQIQTSPGVLLAARLILSERETAQKIPTDPEWRGTWNEDAPAGKTWGHTLIRLPSAWAVTTGSRSVQVGVIEGGFLATHEDLVGNLTPRSMRVRPAVLGDDTHHGTLVAGIIGASANNGKGYSGVAWDVQLDLASDELSI